MATVIYKDGESTKVEHQDLQNHLNIGWSLTKEPVEEKQVEPVPIEEIDTNQSGKLSNKEIRAAAKNAGIEGWENTRIKTLLKELGHGDKED